MANNRMVLVCNVCHPNKGDWQYDQKGVLAIAKWYPAGGFIAGDDGAYYRNDGGKGLGKEFVEFLSEHQHQEVASEHYSQGAGQENPVRLEYESEGLPIIQEAVKGK
jgi:hypothetical protein